MVIGVNKTFKCARLARKHGKINKIILISLTCNGSSENNCTKCKED